LKNTERLTFRNEIIWNKQCGQGMNSSQHRMFSTASERCLFFMLGEQGFNNNADNYWEGYESIRNFLEKECQKMNYKRKDIWSICGVDMYSHWLTKSQWTFIPEHHYLKLQEKASGDAFKHEYDELKREYDELKREWYATRAYFDNTHDTMTDVWTYPRVQGEERWGHATPKPVDMISRICKSSCPENGLIYSPFLGTGTDIIAVQKMEGDRTVYGMELSPQYVETILQRFSKFTGIEPVLVGKSEPN
jgi:DNA modification methylase